MDKIYVRRTKAGLNEFSLLFLSLKLDKVHVINWASLWEEVFLEPFEDLIVDFNFAHVEFSGDLGRCF